MEFPENLRYTEEHEWVRIEGDVAYVGITDFAQSELGDIVYIDVDKKGYTLARGDVFGTVEAVKTVSDLFLPVSATILEVNAELNDNPETVNSDPYGAGWIIKISIGDNAELDQLLDAAAYSNLVSH